MPSLRAETPADRDAVSTAGRAYARLTERARRAHDAQLALLARIGRAAVSRHERVDARTRSRAGQAGHELDDQRAGALGAVDAAYQDGLTGLELAVVHSRKRVAAASASALRRVRANADTAGAQITAIVNDLAAGYTDLLEQSAVAITTAAGQVIPVVQAFGASGATLFAGGANPLIEAQNEARRAAVPGLARAAVTSLTDASTTQSQAYRDQIPVVRRQFSESELGTALTTRKEEIDTKGRAAVRKATGEAYAALTRQAASGRDALRRMAGGARESIELRHKAARTRLAGEAGALLTGSHARATAELTGLDTAAKTGLPAFDRMMSTVRDGLGRAAAISPDSLRRTADEAVDDAGPKVDQLGVLQQRMVDRADATTGASVADAEQAAVQAAGLTRAEAVRGLRAAGTGGAQGMADFVHGHDASFAAMAQGVRQVADAWATPLKKVFGDAVSKTKDAMTGPFTEWKTKTDHDRNTFIGGVFTPFMTPATKLAGALDAAAEPVRADLEGRKSGLERAFEYTWGTDEAGVSRSLRGLTPTQGRALTWLWERDNGSLDAALRSELSGDELDSARAYLRGDQAAGAAAELRASLGFFNDDEARIEESMRNLKPEELAKLKGSKEGAAALTEVRDSLGGTDLKVFDALAAGNQDLADAFRMKDRIDSARQAGDVDALHDVFIDYGKAPTERGRAPATADERRVAVQRELAGIISGTTGTGPAPISRQDAAAAVERYALAPIDVVVAGPEGTSTTERREITGANRALAVALIAGGADTVAARTARLGVETQRPGGPNLLKLDAALVDPRLKPGAQVPEEERRKALDERNQVIRNYATEYGGADKAGTAAAATDYLEGRLRAAYGGNTDGADLAVRLARETYPTPKTAAMAVKYASAGAGTDEALMFRFVERMDRDEIAAMRREYKDLAHTELDDDLGTFGGKGWFTELSGDERLRMEVALLGVPRNDRERAEVASFRIQQQRDETGWLGRSLAGDSIADRSLALAQSRLTASLGGATVKVDDKGNPVWTDAEGRPTAAGGTMFDREGRYGGKDPAEFASAVRVAKLAAENYAAKIDSFATYLTTAVMVIGAIAAAVVTVATGGAASPLLMAAIAGLTGISSMVVHSAVSGGRYGWEQAAVDLGMTAVQALTAGVGQHLSIVARGGSQSFVAGMTTLRQAQNLGKTLGGITGNALGDLMVIGAATGGLGSFGGALLDEATWSKGFGHGFATLLAATLTGAAAGVASTVTSQAFESLPFGRAVAGQRPTISDAVSESLLVRSALRGTSSFLGGATGRGVGLGIESATGRFHGDAGDILEEMGRAGLQSAIEESAAGPLEKPVRRTGPGQDHGAPADHGPSRPPARGGPADRDHPPTLDELTTGVRTPVPDQPAETRAPDVPAEVPPAVRPEPRAGEPVRVDTTAADAAPSAGRPLGTEVGGALTRLVGDAGEQRFRGAVDRTTDPVTVTLTGRDGKPVVVEVVVVPGTGGETPATRRTTGEGGRRVRVEVSAGADPKAVEAALARELTELQPAGTTATEPVKGRTREGENTRDERDTNAAVETFLLLSTEYSAAKGGVAVFNRSLAEALADAGQNVVVRIGEDPAPYADVQRPNLRIIGPRDVPEGADPRNLLGTGTDPDTMPAKVDYVVGHTRFSGPDAKATRDARYPDAKLIHFVHMVPEALGRVKQSTEAGEAAKGIVNHAIERGLVAGADLAAGVGPAITENVREMVQQARAMPEPVSTRAVHELIPGMEFRERTPRSVEGRPLNVYISGRADVGQKGVVEAAQVVAMLREAGIDAKLIVRGVPGELVARQKAVLSEIVGADVDVRPFTVDRADLRVDLDEADIVVMTSRAEGFGLTAQEAAASGIPTVVPSSSGFGRWLGEPGRFPDELTRPGIVAQGFEDQVPKDLWFEALRTMAEDYPAAQQRALDLQQRFKDGKVTWETAVGLLIEEARRLR